MPTRELDSKIVGGDPKRRDAVGVLLFTSGKKSGPTEREFVMSRSSMGRRLVAAAVIACCAAAAPIAAAGPGFEAREQEVARLRAETPEERTARETAQRALNPHLVDLDGVHQVGPRVRRVQELDTGSVLQGAHLASHTVTGALKPLTLKP